MSRISFEHPLTTNHTHFWYAIPYITSMAEMLRDPAIRTRRAPLYLWRLCWLRARGAL